MSMICRATNKFTRAVGANDRFAEATLVYIASDPENPTSGLGTDALDAVKSNAPPAVDGAALDHLEITGNPGPGVFEIEAVYRRNTTAGTTRAVDRRAGDKYWRFDASHTTARVLEAEELLNAVYASGAPASLHYEGRAVNWNGRNYPESVVRGVDIVAPEMRESCIATWLPGRITTAYKRRIMNLVGCVNSTAFNGWVAGEVLFLGAAQSAAYRNRAGTELVDVTYNFAIRPNRSQVSRGGLAVGTVHGWEYVWDVSGFDPQSGDFKTYAAYVDRLYRESSFAALGI